MHFKHREDVLHKTNRYELKRLINWFIFVFQAWIKGFFGKESAAFLLSVTHSDQILPGLAC